MTPLPMGAPTAMPLKRTPNKKAAVQAKLQELLMAGGQK